MVERPDLLKRLLWLRIILLILLHILVMGGKVLIAGYSRKVAPALNFKCLLRIHAEFIKKFELFLN